MAEGLLAGGRRICLKVSWLAGWLVGCWLVSVVCFLGVLSVGSPGGWQAGWLRGMMMILSTEQIGHERLVS